MASHQASASMLGYLFQLHCGLFLLLDDDNERVSVCLEKYDDVTIVNEIGNHNNYQLKLHTKAKGSLTDSSTDLWRTLNAWIDLYKNNPDKLSDTQFTIITNAIAPQGSVADMLRFDNKQVNDAYDALKNIAKAYGNKNHDSYYNAFLSIKEDEAKQLLYRVSIVDNSGDIQIIDNKIRGILKYSVGSKYVHHLFERLFGWWIKKAEDALLSDALVLISQREVRATISQIASEYIDDNLPIDEFDETSIPELKKNEKIFQKQLNLLEINARRLKLSKKNYYRAFVQRTKWINEELTFVTELENYEKKLIEEWEHYFAQMEGKLCAIDQVTDENKRLAGIDLLNKVEDKDIRIRDMVSEPFVMRGSYHMLADDLRVGWHIDYETLPSRFTNTNKEVI